jgi:flagellar FliL protein
MAEEAIGKQEEEQKEPVGKEKKGLPIKPIIIAVFALLLIGGGFFILKLGFLPKLMGKDALQSLAVNDGPPEMGPIYSLDTFIVNLVGGKNKNYLKVKVDLEMDDIKLKEEIDKRLPQFRDVILTLLSNKTNDEIRTLEGKFQLRAEIIAMLNQNLRTGKIVSVYFTDFIVQ